MNTIAGGSDLLSYYNEAYGSSNTGSANKLQNTLSNADYSQASEDELYDVCKQFESYFVEQVIKQMKDTFTSDDDGDSTMSQYKDLYMDQAIETVADEMVDQIGESYTQTLYEQMKRNICLLYTSPSPRDRG